jgi:protein-tyrosine phosphatase
LSLDDEGSTRQHWASISSRRRVYALLVAVGLATTLAYTFRRPWFQGNLGVVDAGRVYRSAQPVEGLRQTLITYRVASVINLRGGSEDDAWYAAEVRETGDQGVDFYDFPLSATRRPSRRELLTLLDFFNRCKYPLLIHCKSGSDRTGLVSGLYLMAERNVAPARAVGAFSLSHGHVPLFGPEHLHEPFLEYDAWLKSNHLAHNPVRLLEWVQRIYRDPDATAHFTPLRPGPRVRLSRGTLGTKTS